LPLRAHRAVEADLVNVCHVLAKNGLTVTRPNRRVSRDFTLHAGLEHVEIRAVGIYHGKIPDFVRTRSEKDLFPVSRPARVIGIIARYVFENVNFSRGNVDDGDMTCVRRVARFLCCVKRDASSIRRDRREDAVRDLFSLVPSRLAIQTACSRSNAMCRSPQKTDAAHATSAKRRSIVLFMTAIQGWRKRSRRGPIRGRSNTQTRQKG